MAGPGHANGDIGVAPEEVLVALWAFVALMAAIEIYVAFGPAPLTGTAEAKSALLA